MKKKEKKMLIKHIKKDDEDFRSQIKDDMKLNKYFQKQMGKSEMDKLIKKDKKKIDNMMDTLVKKDKPRDAALKKMKNGKC